MSRILKSREERGNLIQHLIEKVPVVISVKANIPGTDKNIVSAHIIVSLFTNIIHQSYKKEPVKHMSEDGPYSIFEFSDDGNRIKKEMEDIENTHPLGRYVDIDVYSLHSEFHRINPRQCFICGEEAFRCAKLQSHSIGEYLSKINDDVLSYLRDVINQNINESMLDELHLHPKFGLVTKESNGSHEDMNYQLMVKAKDAIRPFLLKIFEYTFLSKDPNEFELFHIKAIGMAAEKAMYEATNHINAYKGLIFHLGYVMYALAKVLKNRQPFDQLFDWLILSSSGYEETINLAPDSYGKKMYIEHNIGGARHEMALGLPRVKEAMNFLLDYSRVSLYNTLKYLITHVEDTTLYKRAGLNLVQNIKRRFEELDITDEVAISKLTEQCIASHLSFGGSADLLVVSLFLKRMKALLF